MLLAGWRCTDAEAASLSPLLRDLARGAGEYRSIAPRLSISRGYAPCRETPPPADGTVTRAACPAVPAEAASSRSVRRVSAAAGDAGVEPDALHAGALIDLLWGGTGKTLDRAIQSLHTAARLSDRPAPLLADLAAAYLLRAERMQTPGDLDRALEAAEEAMELDSANTAALYNRALALERIGLADAADDAWRTYLRVDHASGWADEARAWLRHTVVADVAPPADPTPASAAEFARRAPQQANAWGWETLLPAWAAAYQSGNAAAAESALRLAESVGAALVAARRDATLADAVAAIRAAAPATLDRLARGHRAYDEARRLYDAGMRKAAEPLFRQVATEGAAASPTLGLSARLFHAASLAYGGDPSAEPRARDVVAEADSARYPALAGRARWIVGTILVQRGHNDEGRQWFLRAIPCLRLAGEDEHLGSVQFLAASALLRMGGEHGGNAERHRALRRLQRYPGSVWQHNLLIGSGASLNAAGLPRAALHYHSEDVRVSRRTGRALYEVEARLGRARLLAAQGRRSDAKADVDRAGGLVDSIADPERRPWFANDLRLARVEVTLPAALPGAAAELDSAVVFFQARPAKLLPALLTRAEARLAAGDAAGARFDLQAASQVMLQRAADIRAVTLRGALFQQARHLFDRLILSHVAAGEHRVALEQLEHARAVFAPFPRERAPGLQFRPGVAGVEYALVGDTLLTWTVVGDSVSLSRRTVDGDRLARDVERLRSVLELRRDDEEMKQGLGELYDLLMRPLEGRIGRAGEGLVVVADGVLAGIPFAALYDRARGRYLVQERPVRLAATLAGQADLVSPPPSRVVLVADPAFDRAVYPAFAPLPGAAAEVAAIAPLYDSANALTGTAADRSSVLTAAASAELLHFAGHAVLDDARPEQSFLLLAGGGDRGRLTAEDFTRIDLRGVKLVVLSACETAQAPNGRSGGLAGLSAALLGAGAEGVIGSLWRVDDELTRTLMMEFHRAYRGTGDAAAALRSAQLALVGATDPRLRSPAAWAGFVHIMR